MADRPLTALTPAEVLQVALDESTTDQRCDEVWIADVARRVLTAGRAAAPEAPTPDPHAPVAATIPGTGSLYRLMDSGEWWLVESVDAGEPIHPSDVVYLVPVSSPAAARSLAEERAALARQHAVDVAADPTSTELDRRQAVLNAEQRAHDAWEARRG